MSSVTQACTYYQRSYNWQTLREANLHLTWSENNVGQTLLPLGPRVVILHDFPLLVVDFLALFVTHEEYDTAEEENGRTPPDSVRPTELPDRAVTYEENALVLTTM